MSEQPEPWWRQAQADLELAEYCFEGGRWYGVSWFAQQAVEKGLKALFVKEYQALHRRATCYPRWGAEFRRHKRYWTIWSS